MYVTGVVMCFTRAQNVASANWHMGVCTIMTKDGNTAFVSFRRQTNKAHLASTKQPDGFAAQMPYVGQARQLPHGRELQQETVSFSADTHHA